MTAVWDAVRTTVVWLWAHPAIALIWAALLVTLFAAVEIAEARERQRRIQREFSRNGDDQ